MKIFKKKFKDDVSKGNETWYKKKRRIVLNREEKRWNKSDIETIFDYEDHVIAL